eukprot:3963261-Amphidinium_carterae.1
MIQLHGESGGGRSLLCQRHARKDPWRGSFAVFSLAQGSMAWKRNSTGVILFKCSNVRMLKCSNGQCWLGGALNIRTLNIRTLNI